MQIRPLIELARPRHWVKNVVVFMPVVFGLQVRQTQAWISALIAAAAFCLVSSFAYVVNDIKDRQSDQAHPAKRHRPVASARISVRTAVNEAFVLLVAALILARSLSRGVLLMVLAYAVLQLAYTMLLKDKALLDVICIAMGFVIRTASGAVATRVAISPWLFICMFTICLFMGFCKRYSEIVTISNGGLAQNHRPTLIAYTPELLTHLITISAAIAVVAFLLYGLHERTVEQFGTNYFIYTLPVAVYAVFRFAMLSMKGSYQDPTELILRDRPFQLTVLLWAGAMVAIIFWGSNFSTWIQKLG